MKAAFVLQSFPPREMTCVPARGQSSDLPRELRSAPGAQAEPGRGQPWLWGCRVSGIQKAAEPSCILSEGCAPDLTVYKVIPYFPGRQGLPDGAGSF